MSDDQTKPVIPYWHLYTDEDGISRQRQCRMTAFDMKAIASGRGPAMAGRKTP